VIPVACMYLCAFLYIRSAPHLTAHFESVLLLAFWFFRNSRVRMDEITNYFTIRQTSGFVEDNKVKVLRRRCYEITSLTRLFQRPFLDLGGYRLFGL
jgi:transposase